MTQMCIEEPLRTKLIKIVKNSSLSAGEGRLTKMKELGDVFISFQKYYNTKKFKKYYVTVINTGELYVVTKFKEDDKTTWSVDLDSVDVNTEGLIQLFYVNY